MQKSPASCPSDPQPFLHHSSLGSMSSVGCVPGGRHCGKVGSHPDCPLLWLPSGLSPGTPCSEVYPSC